MHSVEEWYRNGLPYMALHVGTQSFSKREYRETVFQSDLGCIEDAHVRHAAK